MKGYTGQTHNQHHTKWRKTKVIPLKSGMRQDVHYLPSVYYSAGSTSWSTKARDWNERDTNKERRSPH